MTAEPNAVELTVDHAWFIAETVGAGSFPWVLAITTPYRDAAERDAFLRRQRAELTRMGLVSEACGDTELEARAETLCRQLAALPPSTVRSVKALMRPEWDRERLEAAIADELTRFVAGLRSPEHREAVSAFLEKRVPDFSNFA